ncbi:MAG: MarR family transcriptional regulator [Deltaproteobacteria bacterium]|nr:MarR family transcriptional regulator [Deltaproteobacteria bacterium]
MADAHLLRALARWLLPAVARLDRLASRALEEGLAAHGITLPQFRIVGALLGETTGLTQRELAARIRVEAPTLSVAVAKLEAAGVVERAADPTDGRAWRVRLASKGDRIAPVIETLRTLEQRATAGISAEDLVATRRVLDRVVHNLESS